MEKDEIKLIIDKLIRVIPFEGISDETLLNPSCGLINIVKSRNRGLFRLHRI